MATVGKQGSVHREGKPVEISVFRLSVFTIAIITGLVLPSFVAKSLKGNSPWLNKAIAMHEASIASKNWKAPWIAIQPNGFSSAWIECQNLNDALRLDKEIDDGNLAAGTLRMAQGGLAWIPEN